MVKILGEKIGVYIYFKNLGVRKYGEFQLFIYKDFMIKFEIFIVM